MSIFEAIIQGIIQGVTEFLPVSSSGHLSLFQHFTNQSGEPALLFSVMLHMGTLFAIVIAFYKLIWELIKEFFAILKDIFTLKFSLKKTNPMRNMIYMILLALLPLIVIYFVLGDFYSMILSDDDIIIEGLSFLITATLLFIACKKDNGTKLEGDITAKDALIVGALQSIAPLPGVSRSGSTISSGLLCGFKKETAVKFSFILGIPAILGGGLSEILDMSGKDISLPIHIMAIGVITSAVVGYLSIKMVEWLLKEDKFKIFAYYTLVLGVVVIAIGVFENFFV